MERSHFYHAFMTQLLGSNISSENRKKILETLEHRILWDGRFDKLFHSYQWKNISLDSLLQDKFSDIVDNLWEVILFIAFLQRLIESTNLIK